MIKKEARSYDLKVCPKCFMRDHLVIRWIPDIEHLEYTEVGCEQCGILFRGSEVRYAIADWNLFVITENEAKGRIDPSAELYRLLHTLFQEEQKVEAARDNVDKYLDENVRASCPFAPGDRLRFLGKDNGVWSTESVRCAYAINTGPFWILTARNVLPSGRLGNHRRDFSQRDADSMVRLKGYWKPYNWRQVVEGDCCLYKESLGRITAVSYPKKWVSVICNEKTFRVHQLRFLKVPNMRVE